MTAAMALLAALFASSPIADELSRLEGHDVAISDDGRSYVIRDVAGEGAPVVGVIERAGTALILVADGGDRLELEGPLAVPRIAGPGYKVWVIGERVGARLKARRLGVLRSPR